jgi:hypothetical protein
MLSEVSQAQKHKGCIDPKGKHMHRNKHDPYKSSDVELNCNSGTTLWNSGKEGKKIIELQ